MNDPTYGIWPLFVFNSVLFMVFAASYFLFKTRRAFNALHPLLAPRSTSAQRLEGHAGYRSVGLGGVAVAAFGWVRRLCRGGRGSCLRG